MKNWNHYAIGVPDAKLHNLRHSHVAATLDDIKTVQNNLGHRTVSFTLDVYSHVTEQVKQAQIRWMSPSARSRRRNGEIRDETAKEP